MLIRVDSCWTRVDSVRFVLIRADSFRSRFRLVLTRVGLVMIRVRLILTRVDSC